ncbi:MAG: hypothetical protein H9W81_07575 [Enterococcus sp.]|nr:hypothetical protein [Enterococcus sp.]
MFKKSRILTFTSREELATYLATEMKRNRLVSQRYQKPTVEAIQYTHFDIRNAIRLTPEVFPSAPHIVDGELIGEIYTLDTKNLKAALSTVWDYEWEGTISLATAPHY